jgi:hypothetical protein
MTFDNRTSAHLTEDEIDEVLMGTASSGFDGHLARCSECRARLEQFHASMSLFNQATTVWSEAKSNAIDRDLTRHRTPFRLSAAAMWSCASVLLLILAGAAGMGLHNRAADLDAANRISPHVQPVGEPSANTYREKEIANDNALMADIDSAINNSEPSPEEFYYDVALSKVSTHASRRNSHRTQVAN